jgi:hypothetical protein
MGTASYANVRTNVLLSWVISNVRIVSSYLVFFAETWSGSFACFHFGRRCTVKRLRTGRKPNAHEGVSHLHSLLCRTHEPHPFLRKYDVSRHSVVYGLMELDGYHVHSIYVSVYVFEARLDYFMMVCLARRAPFRTRVPHT